MEIANFLQTRLILVNRRISILHGRPASITDTDVDADLPVDLPSLHSTTTADNYANMLALINLTLKLGKIAQEM